MRLFLGFWLIAILLCSAFMQTSHALEEPMPVHKLPALIVPDVPLDDNPFGREVFSLNDLREKNLRLMERIIATRMDFPLMFDPFGRFARELFPKPERARFGKNFMVIIRMSPILWRDDSMIVLKNLQSELVAQGLDRGRAGRDMRLEFLVFVRNYETLRDYTAGFPGVGDEARRETADTLEDIFGVCRQVLEFKVLTLNGIRSLEEMGDPVEPASSGGEELLFERFIAESKGMKQEDINSILEIRDPALFRQLCLERTAELLAESERENVEELLSNVGPSDAIVLAAYFARDRIKEYQNPLDQISHKLGEDQEEFQVGDCRHFAGLAIHYLNLVVKPINPKLRTWRFGIERADISDYHHAYVAAADVKKVEGQERIDLFFFDPVALAAHAPEKLRTKDVRRLIDAASTDDHFFSIKRYGEDFVARKNPKKPLRDAPRPEQEITEITVETLLNE